MLCAGAKAAWIQDGAGTAVTPLYNVINPGLVPRQGIQATGCTYTADAGTRLPDSPCTSS